MFVFSFLRNTNESFSTIYAYVAEGDMKMLIKIVGKSAITTTQLYDAKFGFGCFDCLCDHGVLDIAEDMIKFRSVFFPGISSFLCLIGVKMRKQSCEIVWFCVCISKNNLKALPTSDSYLVKLFPNSHAQYKR